MIRQATFCAHSVFWYSQSGKNFPKRSRPSTDELLSSLVDERVLGGGGLGFESVDELNSGNYVRQELGGVEEPPFLGSGLHQLEDQGEAGEA
jgi:hypothetical protein